jgi:ditrans,polycis-polyprenyl diphosphate synthase
MGSTDKFASKVVKFVKTFLNWVLIGVMNLTSSFFKPTHLGVIMDGNRRFARKHAKKVVIGHDHGFKKLMDVTRYAMFLNIQYVTVYAFSVENFNRTKEEVDGLMNLAEEKFTKLIASREKLERYGLRIRILGEKSMLAPSLQEVIRKLEECSKGNSRVTLNICIPYTSRHELVHCVKHFSQKVANGEMEPSEITESLVDKHLYTEGRKVDLMLRTSGEHRLSDFLLWQTSDGLLEFLEVLWPDTTFFHVLESLIRYHMHELHFPTFLMDAFAFNAKIFHSTLKGFKSLLPQKEIQKDESEKVI